MTNSDKITQNNRRPNYLLGLLNNRCARCRRGPMFKHKLGLSIKSNMEMNENCPVCGQPLELEVGFYYGTGYVSYALTVALSVAVFVAYWVLIGISINDNSLFYYLGVNGVILLLLMPYIMRLSRTIWLSFFVKYDADWHSKEPPKPERIVEEQMNNW
ncbi:MAG: DUF983 domain-containing protein [Chitinophagaceae bacterium]|nr:DUF983 domain-containing protein [Chitinophagaceae bacterium]